MKKQLKQIIIFVFLISMHITSFSQTPPPPCEWFENYAPIAAEKDYFPVRRIRVVFHVLQRNDGTGNIVDNPAGRAYINAILNHLNGMMRNTASIDPPSYNYGPDIIDTRIEYSNNCYDCDPQRESIFFHQDNPDNALFDYCKLARPEDGGLNPPDIAYIYDQLVTNKASLYSNDETFNSFHCFLTASDNHTQSGNAGVHDDQYQEKGACIRHVYKSYLANNWWSPAMTILHEFGHLLGLQDNWPSEKELCQDYNRRDYSNNVMTYGANQAAFSACQAAKMYAISMGIPYPLGIEFLYYLYPYDVAHYAVIDDWNTYHPNDPIIIENGKNVTWEGQRYLLGDLIIEPGAQLTIKCLVHMPPGSNIIVNPGGLLTIDGGTVTNTLEGWDGIIVEGNASLNQVTIGNQGKVVIKNKGTIENALDGILVAGITGTTIDWNKTGGIIYANEAKFINNRRDVLFMRYHPLNSANGEHNNRSRFIDCDFITNDDAIFATSYIAEHIRMLDVNGIRFIGCRFKDDRTAINFRTDGRRGIYTDFSSFRVDGICTSQTYPCTTYDNSSFINLKHGIFSRSNGTRGSVTIDHSDFDCGQGGVFLFDIDNSRIRANDFDIDPVQNISGNTDYTYGLYLDNCSYFDVEFNKYHGSTDITNVTTDGSAGLVIRNSGADNNEFYRGEFDNLKVASEVLSENRSISPKLGLKFRCNDYENNYDDLFITDDPGRPSTKLSQLGMAEYQGSAQLTADNYFGNSSPIIFRNIENNTYNNSSLQGNWIDYYHIDEVFGSRYKPSAITPNITLNKITIDDRDCPDLINTPINTPVYDDKVWSTRSSMVQLHKDWDDVIDGGNTGNIKQNILTATAENVNTVYNNLVTLSPWLSIEVLAEVANVDFPFTESMIRDVLVANPHAGRSLLVNITLENRSNPLSQQSIDDIQSAATQFSARDAFAENMAYQTWEHDGALNELTRRYAADTLDTITMGDFDTLMMHPVNHNYHYRLAEMYFDRDNYANYDEIRNNIPVAFNLNENELTYHNSWNEFYQQIKTWKQAEANLMEADANREAWLLNFVATNSKVPPRVYTLLAINNNVLITADVVMPEGNIPPPDPESKNGLVDEIKQPNSAEIINIYPNPAENFVIFESNSQSVNNEKGLIRITDIEGKVVSNKIWPKGERNVKINTEHLAPGQYNCRIVSNGNVLENKKLFIIK